MNKKRNEQNELLQKQAIKRNGIVKRILTDYNRLLFNYHNFDFILFSSSPSKYTLPLTTAKIQVNFKNHPSFIIQLKKPKPPPPYLIMLSYGYVKKPFRVKRIELGMSSFGDEFLIKTDDEDFVRNFFSFEIQNSLMKIIDDNPFICFNKGQLYFKITKIIIEEDEFDSFVDIAIMFCDKLRELGIS